MEEGSIRPSKRPLISVVVLLTVIVTAAAFAAAAELDLRSETHLRALERDTVKGEDQFVLPVYEYLSIDYQDPETGGFSLHLHGWGRKELTTSDYFDEDGDGELLYGFLEYARPYGSFSARLGRQHIFSGIVNETVDGLQLACDLGSRFTLSAFGGLPAAYSEENGSGGDLTYGGRLAQHWGRTYQVGLAYQKIVDDAKAVSETAGVDITADLSRHLSISGLSAYNLDTGRWREHRYTADLRLGELRIGPRFHQFDYQDYFSDGPEAGSLFRFLGETEEALTLYGGDAELALGGGVVLAGKATQYRYDLREEDAHYIAGELILGRYSGFEVGAEAGQMQGDSDDNRYRRYRAYLYWQTGVVVMNDGFISADAQLIEYEQEIYGETRAQFYSLGVGGLVVPDLLRLAVAMNYARDPYFDEDVSATISLILDR